MLGTDLALGDATETKDASLVEMHVATVIYLVNENVVEVVGEAPSEGVSELGEQLLLPLHCHQLLVAWTHTHTHAGGPGSVTK